MKYVINYEGKDQQIEVPDGAVLELVSMPLGENNTNITVLYVRDEMGSTLAAFVGAMRFHPETMTPSRRTWAD